MKTASMLAALFSVVALSACSTAESASTPRPSYAYTDTGDTFLGKAVTALEHPDPSESGFYLLFDGIDALASRLVLARQVERGIDAQYYLITDDVIGLLFLRSLLQAADRGVRVRLLVDDILTQGQDNRIVALDTHPNFEIRIYNPIANRARRAFDYVLDFRRVNRRMHNKSFTADGQVTIIGGRNIAAEYFAAREDVNFDDLDAIGFGAVAKDVSRMFDTYWNDEYSVQVTSIIPPPDDPKAALDEVRERFASVLQQVMTSRYGAALENSLVQTLEGDESLSEWSPYRLMYDSPSKSRHQQVDEDAKSILTPMREAIENAEKEFILISPYFVPQKSGVEFFRRLRDRGIAVTVITNSLASTNQPMVHTGYSRYRGPLLELGVSIYEMRPDTVVAGTERSGAESSQGNLHLKAFIVDREELFVGSFNWDPRSAYINTESGVIIESPKLAAQAAAAVDRGLAEEAYRLELDERGRLRWIDERGGGRVVLTREPQAGLWRRIGVTLMRVLPIEGQL